MREEQRERSKMGGARNEERGAGTEELGEMSEMGAWKKNDESFRV